VNARIQIVQDLAEALEQLDPTLPIRIALDGQEHAAYVAAVVELPADRQSGWGHGVWIRITGGVELGQNPFAPRDVWSQHDD
jgi:hypothetical protein